MWKIGTDIKDTFDRVIIEKAMKDVMDVRRDEFIQSIEVLAKLGAQSVAQGGTSCMDWDRLIEDIKSISLLNK